MGSFSLIHWIILAVVIMLLFGGNRFSAMMGDVAKGLKSFKKGMEEEDPRAAPPGSLPPPQPGAYPPPPHQPGAAPVPPPAPSAQPPIDLTPHRDPSRPDEPR